MENQSNPLNKLKREVFITDVTKDESRVKFSDLLSSRVEQSPGSVPVRKANMQNQQSEASSVGHHPVKMWGLNKLKNLLKEQKERMRTQQEGLSNLTYEDKPKKGKYHKLSVEKDEFSQPKIEKENTDISSIKKRTTIKAILQQRSHTEKNSEDYEVNLTTHRKLAKRRKCRITTQQQFQDECNKYIKAREKEQVDELFRVVNRQMKLSEKKEEGNNYYQKIRKDALRKIDYMSYNQKYYDNVEVKHLNSVVDNCNLLIHKRSPPKKTGKRKMSIPKDRFNNLQLTQLQFTEKQDDEQTEIFKRTSISSRDELSKCRSLQTLKLATNNKLKRLQSDRTFKQQDKQKIQQKISRIVLTCENEIKQLKDVKSGMKIFEYYCDRIDTGFAVRGNRLDNYLKSQQN